MITKLPQTLSASAARSNFYKILNDVSTKYREFTITKNGTVKAVILPLEEVEGWRETMDIMSDTELMEDIRESLKELDAGKGISHEKMLLELDLEGK